MKGRLAGGDEALRPRRQTGFGRPQELSSVTSQGTISGWEGRYKDSNHRLRLLPERQLIELLESELEILTNEA